MQALEKRKLKQLNKIAYFRDSLKALSTTNDQNTEQLSYLLHCSLVFLDHYQADRRFTSYAEFSYYLILKYAVTYNDYQPLYDFSLNFGFYPIVKSIRENKLIDRFTIQGICEEEELGRFKTNQYYETLHQFVEKKKLLEDNSLEVSFIAPTSFGKSSVIVDCIKAYGQDRLRILIIVPTKSLLMQTYRMIREADLQRKIIIHDEMFQNESSFIAVFTQERALRLLYKAEVSFDLMFLDEAHNILDGNFRSILITRTLRINKLRNPGQKIIYLSPLINDIQNITLEASQEIKQHKVGFNIKEPEIYEFRLDNTVHQYNRFVDEFYPQGTAQGKFQYVLSTAGERNFLYAYSPRKIECLAKELAANIPTLVASQKLAELIKILKQEVHESFYIVDYASKGVIYLHGKLPDLIKEYLESKFRELPEIRYLVANSVILEGMNLPIDTLYIFNTHGLSGKELTNLIGRVNRLNTIFTSGENNLYKLLPKVHFINSEYYNRAKSNMANKIVLLRSNIFKDLVKNPTLEAFDINSVSDKSNATATLEKITAIQSNELFLSSSPQTEVERIKIYVIQSGITEFYRNVDQLSGFLADRIIYIKGKNNEWKALSMLEKIYQMFIVKIGDEKFVKDLEFKRISYPETRNHYENYITISQRKSLRENIIELVKYFQSRVEKNNVMFYFGESYGEKAYVSDEYNGEKEVYVDLSEKSFSELVNLAIVKLKLEDDFVAYKLNKFIVMMYDFNLISADDYHEYVYGTTDEKKISLSKIGLNVSLISRLERDGQLGNLVVDQFNNLRSTPVFDHFKTQINDFYRFEIDRFIN
ncbi:DEAD/DEAH box helicase [Pedobacter rhizosphaerae]|uniref:Superfamily II DNA or RNA helicase n=1 Tax=Pedobacter rhizosphaerae TaxID=390241 RepID=A0A1H9N2S5_9SPHI|nr:DEAD/DEAH box helicase [Pedobacter rhizosphaerae]SER30121.1 Superfamily II DNA or RNA helicase [Pedobacter rhizosphaerae]